MHLFLCMDGVDAVVLSDLMLSLTPRIICRHCLHSVVGMPADALPLVAGPYLSPPSARPSSTCALQLCRQVLTGSYQHRHKDLDEKFLNYPVKDNVDLQGVMEGEGNESVIVPFADEGVTVKTAENGSGGNEVSAVYAVDGENTGMNVEGVTRYVTMHTYTPGLVLVAWVDIRWLIICICDCENVVI